MACRCGNMRHHAQYIVTEQKRRYTGTRKGRGRGKSFTILISQPEFTNASLRADRVASQACGSIRSEVDHNKLKEVLVENMWAHLGDIVEELGSSGDEF